jgi:hypothetical protein
MNWAIPPSVKPIVGPSILGKNKKDRKINMIVKMFVKAGAKAGIKYISFVFKTPEIIAHSDMKIMNGYVIFIKFPVRERVSSDKPEPRIKANPSEKRKTGIYIKIVTIRVNQKVVLKKF